MTEQKIKIQSKISKRLNNLDEYVFSQIARAKKKALKSGLDIIDLGRGNPDLPPSETVIQSLQEAVEVVDNHRHPTYEGTSELRRAIADWFGKRFEVGLDPETEILILLGSKDGLSHINFAFIDPGDYALVPDPAYPVYKRGVILAGGEPLILPLSKQNNWLPDLKAIDKKKLPKCKICFLNYPNNPTGAIANRDFFQRSVEFALKNQILICHDMAYSEITFNGHKALSILQIKEAKNICLEFHSFSKTYSMTGWRLGFVVGSRNLIDALRKVKLTTDSGVFHVIQKAAIKAFSLSYDEKYKVVKIYQKRRDILYQGLKKLGWDVDLPKGGIFIWAKYGLDLSSEKVVSILLEEAGVLTTPGRGLGEYGEGYLRFSLTAPEEKLIEAIKRIEKIDFPTKLKT